METLTFTDSPLAQYLEETHQQNQWITSPVAESPAASSSGQERTKGGGGNHGISSASFAPTGMPTLGKSFSSRLPQPLRLSIPNCGPVARIHGVCSRAVNSRLGRADNARFLEQFRYLLISSQLLSEQQGNHAGNRASCMPNLHASGAHMEEYQVAATSITGALVTTTTAFAAVWLVHWSRYGHLNEFSKGRVLVVVSAFIFLAIVLYAYAKRQWLQYLRKNAVTAGSTLVTNLQAFEASTSAALSLVQEVELVSRGYQISIPLSPITRLEESPRDTQKRCLRLRRCIRSAYAANLSPFREACNYLKALISDDDLERYLEVYDVNSLDIEEARLGYTTDEFDDLESLKALRIFQARLSVLRRVFLCSLLSMEANGAKPDFARWRIAVDSMELLASTTGEWAERINAVLTEEEQFLSPQPATPQQRFKERDPERERVRSQIRRLGTLSTGMRGLQAKLQILREESTKSLDESDDKHDFGPSLMAQYDSIGTDLKSLLQSWESGKAAMTTTADRRESRRFSHASSGFRSPVLSLGGLTAVEESNGFPSDALRALNGETSIRSKTMSTSSSGGSPAPSTSDEEIFEAIANPRSRHSLGGLNRDQRIAKMLDERERMASFRERRESGMSMMRELESVINLRPSSKRTSHRASWGGATAR